VAADVVPYDAKAGVGESGGLGVPEAEVGAVAVDEDDGRAFAGVFVEGDDAVSVGVRHQLQTDERTSGTSREAHRRRK